MIKSWAQFKGGTIGGRASGQAGNASVPAALLSERAAAALRSAPGASSPFAPPGAAAPLGATAPKAGYPPRPSFPPPRVLIYGMMMG